MHTNCASAIEATSTLPGPTYLNALHQNRNTVQALGVAARTRPPCCCLSPWRGSRGSCAGCYINTLQEGGDAGCYKNTLREGGDVPRVQRARHVRAVGTVNVARGTTGGGVGECSGGGGGVDEGGGGGGGVEGTGGGRADGGERLVMLGGGGVGWRWLQNMARKQTLRAVNVAG